MLTTDDERALALLQAYEPGDEVLGATLERVWALLEGAPAVAVLDELALYVADFRAAPEVLRTSRYATRGCKALLAESTIVADETFLLEMEAAVRSFEQSDHLVATPYLRSDEDLFGLVDRISSDPRGYVERLRRLDAALPGREDRVREILVLVYLYFLAHEVGHLAAGEDERDFTSFVDENAPPVTHLANAVVKLRRHAEDFAHYSFDLPGFEHALETGSEVEQASAALQRDIELLHTNHTAWFAGETTADAAGLEIVVEHVRRVAEDADAGDRCMYYAVRGLFAVALYSWYRDLRAFCRAMGGDGLPNSRSLSLAMAQSRETYVNAASLFGDVHRFTLLRAERAIEALIKSRSDMFEPGGADVALVAGEGNGRGRLLLETAARYYLLAYMMDTAVKISYIGASTAWILDADELRGVPQMLVMTFESVATALARVQG